VLVIEEVTQRSEVEGGGATVVPECVAAAPRATRGARGALREFSGR
jgi:hypothetical protein